MKKALALMLSIMMVMSLCVVSAETSGATTILDLDFESVTFPVETDEGRDVDWMDIKTSYMDETGTSENDYTDMTGWVYQKDSREYGYVQEMAVDGGKAARFTVWPSINPAQGSRSLVLPFGQTITDGVLTIEFDAEFASYVGSTRYAFGLHDTESTVTAYDPWNTWGDAAYLGGLTYWFGARHELHMNATEKPNMLPDGYLRNGNTANNNPNSGTWVVNSATLIDDNFNILTTATTGASMKTWKYVIDLDNETYTFYLDGVARKELNYIPGGVSSYDAFVATIAHMAGSATPEGSVVEMCLDNILVTHEASSSTEPTDPTEPVDPNVIISEDFSAGNMDKFTGGSKGATSVVAGALSVGKGNYPWFNFGTTLNGTDTYEFSFDIYGTNSNPAGTKRMIVYNTDAAAGMYFSYNPGKGFCFNGRQTDITHYVPNDDVTYTVKMEWNATTKYIYWSVYEKGGSEPVAEAYVKRSDLLNYGSGTSALAGLTGAYFWHENSSDSNPITIDNIVLRKLDTTESYQKPILQLRFMDKSEASDAPFTTYMNGSMTIDAKENTDYFDIYAFNCKVGDTVILAAYDEDDYLMGTLVRTFETVYSDDHGDSYTWLNTYAPESFYGAAKVKAFVLSGYTDGSIQPVTFSKTGYFAALAE